MRALIFDCDGVLGETESRGHMVAFNRMWAELNVPWRWRLESYQPMLRIGGGKERLLALMERDDFQAAWKPPATTEERIAVAASWHRRKSEIFREIVQSGGIPARPGTRRLAAEALDRGWHLAVASTAAEESVAAMMRHVFGDALSSNFSAVLAGDIVEAKKPDPAIYTLCASRLGAHPASCVVIEDSEIGLAAARAAGMRCIVTVSETSAGDDFTPADLVLSHLGEPDDPCDILRNNSNASPRGWLTIADIERL